MSGVFLMKRNDTGPVLEVQLQAADKTPVDISGATVVFNMETADGEALVSRSPASIVDALTGVVQYQWQAGDTAVIGQHRAEFEVTFLSGAVETFPKSQSPRANFITIQVTDDIA